MLRSILLLTSLLFLVHPHNLQAGYSEWKNLRAYRKATGKTALEKKDWLKSDRNRNTARWSEANKHNLEADKGFEEYQTIAQIHDFYVWYDSLRIQQGHEILWVGIASVVSKHLSKTEKRFLRLLIGRKVYELSLQGSKAVFDHFLYKLQEIQENGKVLTADDAREWDRIMLHIEQFEVVSALYQKIDPATIKKMAKMAEGKCLYRLGVPSKLRFKGDLSNAQDRFDFGMESVIPYYLHRKKKQQRQ